MKNLFAILLLLLGYCGMAQTPRWTEYTSRTSAYPAAQYLTGYLAENNFSEEPEADLLLRLSGYAKDQLVENILVDIQSISTLNILNVNAETQEVFRKNSTAVSTATIAGLNTETYYDKKKKIGYAFAYAKKSDVIDHYANDIAQYLDQINTNFTIVKNQKAAGDNQKALKVLFLIQTHLKNVEQGQAMLVTLTGNFNDSRIKRPETNVYKVKLEQELNAVKNTDQFSIDDAAFFIANAIQVQLGKPDQAIQVNNFTYQDTPMGSPFSRKLQASISQKLVQSGFSVVTQSQTGQILVLNGSYWDEADHIKIAALLRDQSSAAALASSDCNIPKPALVANGVVFTPENYKQAMITMREFAEGEVKGGNLNLDVYTNKGKDNLIFTEGELLKLFVRANRECYLRFVYHLADGSKVLLLDNYYINRDHVNQVYELPYEFECAEPFGIETLQLNAQGQPFSPLNTQSQYGYEFILDDTKSIITKSRGFKKVKAGEELKAEKRLVFTTMNR
ncbi:DUF4384 domain-containing protein [Reichenbachiella carrageenanivorans]|uniref:DUF4384 domain-containing protein n=1 Tax=Reichenbachiella carrageenanivorans TaxID=2979869 RepID=A0ABY6D6N3_9BACT|nr:DUF4384 domain-containing protein [Reichenbachiella carrageenanivorans]UXX81270.1 DUF4384 domain-containing protein [Reichenbachiella carrageenanivorans]